MRDQTVLFFELLWHMTLKELRTRYKHTIFGFLWLVVNPVLQMLVIGLIFTIFIKEPVEHYFYHLFIGLVIWNFFSISLNKAAPSLVFERALIKKAVFPRSVIPLSIIAANLANLMAALALLIIPILLLGTLHLLSVPYFLIGTSLLVIFTGGLGLATCALNVRYRDISFFVQAALIIWFYASPIVYSLSQIPDSLQVIWRFNPMTSVLLLMNAAFLGTPPPDPAMLITNSAGILAAGMLGIWIFYTQSRNFDDWV